MGFFVVFVCFLLSGNEDNVLGRGYLFVSVWFSVLWFGLEFWGFGWVLGLVGRRVLTGDRGGIFSFMLIFRGLRSGL